MATKKLNSLKGRVMRLTRMDECGVPVVGACSSIVTAGFISVQWGFQVQNGQEYQQANAWGDFCIDEKDPDRYRWANISVSACEVDPNVLDIFANGNPLTDGTDTVGASFGTDANTEALALEVWTKQAGRNCTGGNPEWGYFVAPFIVNGRIDGNFTIENGPLNMTLIGQGIAASNAADWNGLFAVENYGVSNPILDAGGFPLDDLLAVVRTTVQPPAVTSGCAAIA